MQLQFHFLFFIYAATVFFLQELILHKYSAEGYLQCRPYHRRRRIRYQGRTTQVSSSSQDSTSILDKYIQEWMGEDAVDGLLLSFSMGTELRLFRSAKEIGVPRSSRTIFAECESSKKLLASRSSSELSAHQMAHSGVIAHLWGRRALEPMGTISSSGELAVLPLGMAIQTLIDHVGRFRRASFLRAFPLFFGFLFMAYVVSFVFLWLLVRPTIQLLSNLQLCLLCLRCRRPRASTGRPSLVEQSLTEGTVPRNGFSDK